MIVIYHNPDCGTSRNTLAMIRQSGETPQVIEYLRTPPGRERLVELLEAMAMPVRDLLRRKDTPYDALGLGDPTLNDADLLDAMTAHPILINRPIVVTPRGGAAMPAVGGGGGNPAQSAYRTVRQGGR